MTASGSLAETARRELSGLEDAMVGPQDPGYDHARAVHNGMINRQPGVIIRCASAADVARVIAFARAQGAPLAVRGGGHNGAGLGVVDDGVVLDLAGLDQVVYDAESETVEVGGGCTWGDVDAVTGRARSRHALRHHLDDRGRGLTLGGGIGHLTRPFGLTIDSLIGAEVVLADGSQIHASHDENRELFWALRGGGGNFGVGTSFCFRTHPAGETVMAGPTFWPIEQTPE